MNSSPMPIAVNASAGAEPRHAAWAFRAYQLLTVLFWVAVVVQIFFAGATIFVGGTWRDMHIALGHCLSSPLPLVPLLLGIIGVVGRLPRRVTGLAGLLLLVAMIQPFFLYLRGIHPMIAPFHAVNGMVLFALPLYMLGQLRRIT